MFEAIAAWPVMCDVVIAHYTIGVMLIDYIRVNDCQVIILAKCTHKSHHIMEESWLLFYMLRIGVTIVILLMDF